MRQLNHADRRSNLRLWLLRTASSKIQAVQRGLMALQVPLRRRIAFHRFERRPDDVYIATYPKSGTTLLQMMIHQLRGDGNMDIPHICAVVPWLEAAVLTGTYERFDSLPTPRVFKTHLMRELLPEGKFIYVVRDARDVHVSAYHHQCMLQGQRLGPEAFNRHFQQDAVLHGTWFQHLASWWPHRSDPNVLFLTFEDMTADLEGTVRRVAEFCGLPVDESQMPRILERCSIEFMRRHNDKFDPRLYRFDDYSETFIRKGTSGQWQEELPGAQRMRLEAQARELARELGGDGEAPFAYLLRGKPAPAGAEPARPGPHPVAAPADRGEKRGAQRV